MTKTLKEALTDKLGYPNILLKALLAITLSMGGFCFLNLVGQSIWQTGNRIRQATEISIV